MKKTMNLAILLALALLAGTGCRTQKTSGLRYDKGRLVIENPSFASNLIIIKDAREKMTPENFLHVQVFLENLNHEDFHCQYCFEWYDKNGMTMKHASTHWRPLVLHGREVQEIDSISPLQGAEDYRLKLRHLD